MNIQRAVMPSFRARKLAKKDQRMKRGDLKDTDEYNYGNQQRKT